MGPGDLQELMRELPLERHPDLLVGRETSDDAGVYRLGDELALVQTVDLFTPVVDDPFAFGAIAAANAMSDVYAMGGRPLTAMNIACFPVGQVETATLRAILRGAWEKTREAGALLVGGHTVQDGELKFGLAVTGVVHPARVTTNAACRAGDALLLTKPVGTGVVTTALKRGVAPPGSVEEAARWMLALNAGAAACAAEAGVRACTDVTGFGLAGHALEMAAASGVCLAIDAARVPLLPDAARLSAEGACPGGLARNRAHAGARLAIEGEVEPHVLTLLFDPQTSGGLLAACPRDRLGALRAALARDAVPFWEIGEALAAPAGTLLVRGR